jgi:hypothetical protein
VGLVQKISCPFVKGSIDAIASIQVVNNLCTKVVTLMGIEIKSRVTGKTAQQELETQVQACLSMTSQNILGTKDKRGNTSNWMQLTHD